MWAKLQGKHSNLSLTLLLCAASATAQSWPDQGKLLATGAVSQLEGAGGGGLSPWATIAGYGTRDSYGVGAFHSRARSADYDLNVSGMYLGWADTFEISLAQQVFRGSKSPLQFLQLQQNVLGLKWRVYGDLVADQDSFLPQLALGVQFKRGHKLSGLDALGVSRVQQLGAQQQQGQDWYLAASKLWLANSLLGNLTLRYTKANQMGLLGFGGDAGHHYQWQPELALVYLLDRHWLAGLEYRAKPRNLTLDPEQAWRDVFVSWLPNKSLSLTLAYVRLGQITLFNPEPQHAWYLSAQVSY